MKRRIYTDRELDDNTILIDVLKESLRQIKKWGIQKRDLFEWLTYTTEELGELAKAISEFEYRKGTKEDIYKEAIQVATLSLKIAEMIKAK
jgi:NTP pyrophosphatase (non-canonical NTP hydrolase)